MSKQLTGAVCLLAAACASADGVATDSAALISDGASGGTAGFLFLPPVAPRNPPSGVNVPGLAPEVRLETGAGALVARWPGVLGDATGYHVNLAVRGLGIVDGAPYRFSVRLGERTLGFADARFAANKAALKHLDTTQEVGLVDNATLPFKFRIEAAALVQPLAAVIEAQSIAAAQVVESSAGMASFGLDAAAQAGTAVTLPPSVLRYGSPVAIAPRDVTVATLFARVSDLSLAAPAPALSEQASELGLELLAASQAAAPAPAFDDAASRLYLSLAGYEVERLSCTLAHAFAAATPLSDPRRAAAACGAAASAGAIGDIIRLTRTARAPSEAAEAALSAALQQLAATSAAAAREDRDASRAAAAQALAEKEAALEAEQAALAALKAAAAERYRAAMDAAALELAFGIVGSTAWTAADTAAPALVRSVLDTFEASITATFAPPPGCGADDPWTCAAREVAARPSLSAGAVADLTAAAEVYLAFPVPVCPIDTEDRSCQIFRVLRAQVSAAYLDVLARVAAQTEAEGQESRRYATLANASRPRRDIALGGVRNLKD